MTLAEAPVTNMQEEFQVLQEAEEVDAGVAEAEEEDTPETPTPELSSKAIRKP